MFILILGLILLILRLLCRRRRNTMWSTGPCVQDFIMWHNQEIRDFERRRAYGFHD
jgi:hypothetical protein